MWIVPKNLHTSHFALDTEALTLDYNALSELCAQSLLVRSSPTLARTWLRKWKQDSWTPHLFGRILKPSHGASFAGKWTSCQVASLVSPLAPLASAEETRTPDTCSPTSSEDSESWADLPLFSSKMWKESLAPSSQETRGQTPQALPFCSMSSASWSEWVTRSRQDYSARLKSERPTNGSAPLFLESAQTSAQTDTGALASCWRTPTAQESGKGSKGTWPTPNTSDSFSPNLPHDIGRNYLRTEVLDSQTQTNKLWPTSTTQENAHPQMTLTPTGRRAGAKEGSTCHSMNLCDAAILAEYAEKIADPSTPERLRKKLQNNSPLWVTPCAAETVKGSSNPMSLGQLMIYNDPLLCIGANSGPQVEESLSSLGNPHESLQETADPQTQEVMKEEKRVLNPRWVEVLMGLPVGWTMPSCAVPLTLVQTSCAFLETELSLPPQSEPSVSCGHSSTPLEDEGY